MAESIENVFNTIQLSESGSLIIYPNPTSGRINIIDKTNYNSDVYLYTLQGTLLGDFPLKSIRENSIDLSVYNQGVIILRIGDQVRKVVILE